MVDGAQYRRGDKSCIQCIATAIRDDLERRCKAEVCKTYSHCMILPVPNRALIALQPHEMYSENEECHTESRHYWRLTNAAIGTQILGHPRFLCAKLHTQRTNGTEECNVGRD